MQINKAQTAKQKKIQKRERAKLKRRNQALNNFSFQNQLIDLVSQTSQAQQNDEVEQIVEERQENDPEMQDQKQREQQDKKCIKISDKEYYHIVQVGKYYKTKKDNDRVQTQINTINQNQKLSINGLTITSYTSLNSFIFTIKRQVQAAKFDKYLPTLSTEAKLKFSKDSLNIKNDSVIRSSSKIYLQETTQPWANLPKCIQGNQSLMIIGVKNIGKSTLAEYLLQSQPNDCVLLDCDIGRNSCLEGCVSLSSHLGQKKIWIGELTPLNNLQTYLRAIKYLFEFYNKNWFTKKLVVNTMGYLTGLGQFLLYQIYQIIKPKSIIALQSNAERYQLSNVIQNIKSGFYVNRLYISNGTQRKQTPSSTSIHYYENLHNLNKKSLARFEKMFEGQKTKITNIVDLIKVIKQSNKLFDSNPHLISKKRILIDIYQQSRYGKQQMQGQEFVSYRKLNQEQSVDMRVIVLGKMIDQSQKNLFNLPSYESSSNLLEVSGLGFGFQGKIHYKVGSEGSIGIVNEGMDFEKGFYHLNEKQLIDLQLRYGRLNFIMVSTKGLGSKGVRNNPSKA